MRTTKSFLLIISIGAIALLAGGCGAVDNVREAADDIKNAADNAEKAQKRWEARNEKLQKATFTVVYETEDGSEVTYAQAPPQSVFISDDSIVINDDGTIVTCNNLNDKPECLTSEGEDGGDFFSVYGAQFISGFAELATIVPGIKTEEFSEKIAGRDAECLRADLGQVLGVDTGTEGSVTTCWDKETGVTLRVEETDEDGTTTQFEATSFSTKVDSDLFKPPAKPKSTQDLEDEYQKQIDELDRLTTTTTR